MNCFVVCHELVDGGGNVGINIVEKEIDETALVNKSLLAEVVKESFELATSVNTDEAAFWITNYSHSKGFGYGKYDRKRGEVSWL